MSIATSGVTNTKRLKAIARAIRENMNRRVGKGKACDGECGGNVVAKTGTGFCTECDEDIECEFDADFPLCSGCWELVASLIEKAAGE